MLRTQIVKLARANPVRARSFSVVAARAAEGDTGAPRGGGAASGDAFQKREAANEGMYIKEREKESLRRLKEKMLEQQKHLDELNKNINDLESKSKK